MAKKVIIIGLMSVLFLLSACSSNNTSDTQNKMGIEIKNIVSIMGAIGENANDSETQSFKYTITLTNNEASDIKLVSLTPVLSDKIFERVSNKETEIEVNKTISKEGNLDVTGEIIFDSKGLTKEQIVSLQPFIKDVKIIEERIINKPF